MTLLQTAGEAELSPAQEIVFIDEIKSLYRDVRLLAEPYPLHLAQAKCYACIYAQQHSLGYIGVQMTYCNIETEEIRRFQQIFSADELEQWFGKVVEQYQKWAKLQIEWKKVRQSSIAGLEFPYPWRNGPKGSSVLCLSDDASQKDAFYTGSYRNGKNTFYGISCGKSGRRRAGRPHFLCYGKDSDKNGSGGDV